MGARPAKTKRKGNNGCGCLIFALAFLSMIFTIFVGTSQPSISSAAISFSAKQAELLQSTYATAAATPITLSISSAITNLMISLAATPGPAPLANAPVDARLVRASAAGPDGAATSNTATANTATANDVANLRQGPGTAYAVLGTAQVGQTLTLVGRNDAGDWYQLDSGQWIAAFLVDNAPSALPLASGQPSP